MGLSVGTSLVALAFQVREQQRVKEKAKPHVARDSLPQSRQAAAPPWGFMRRGWVCSLGPSTMARRVRDTHVVAVERGKMGLCHDTGPMSLGGWQGLLTEV